MSRKKINPPMVAGYCAALWAIVFAVLHFVWAMGIYVFLPEDLAKKAFGQKWFLIYDLAAGFLCVVAAVVMLLSVHSFGNPRFRAALKFLLIGGTIILVLRAGAGIGKFIYLLFQKQSLPEAFAYWELWFCLGAGLFAASLWQISQRGKI